MRCLSAIVITIACLGACWAQDASVEYFPCDTDDPIDLKNPDLQTQMINFGIEPEDGKVLDRVLEVTQDKPTETKAYVVRITNTGRRSLPINSNTVKLALAKYGAGKKDRKVSKSINASNITAWAGDKSLFSKGSSVAAGKSAVGVVYFDVASDDAADPSVRLEVEYVVSKNKSIPGTVGEGLLEAVGLEWKTALETAPPAPSGKPRVYPAMGNVNDKTPLRIGRPGSVRPAPRSAAVAHKNIVGEQTQMSMGGGMPGMGGGMPGMGGGMPGMGGGMPGMGGGMPGMGMPGAPGGMPGGRPGGARTPRRPGSR